MTSTSLPKLPSFVDIQDQSLVLAQLENAYKNKRLAHAYLFDGPEGVGKATCARALFAAINCSARPASLQACGTCHSCHKIKAGTHPDWIVMDMAPAGLADEAERIIQRLAYPPHEGVLQLVLIDPADTFCLPTATTAANRLLKTLEEPRDQTMFVFVCTRASALLPTLRSRLQRIRFRAISNEVIQKILHESYPDLEPALLHVVTSMAQGSLGHALQFAEQKEMFQKRLQWAQNLLQAAQSRSAEAIVKTCATKELQDRNEAQLVLKCVLVQMQQQWKDHRLHHPARHTFLPAVRLVQETMDAIQRFTAPQLALEQLLRKLSV